MAEPRLAVTPGPDARMVGPDIVLDRAGFLGMTGSGGAVDSRLFTLLVVDPNVDIRGPRSGGTMEGRDTTTVDVLR